MAPARTELIAAVSLAVNIGMAQPLETGLGICLVAVEPAACPSSPSSASCPRRPPPVPDPAARCAAARTAAAHCLTVLAAAASD
jgi:hypothetical protein